MPHQCVSCKKYFEDINVSENQPSALPISALLPSIQVHISYAQGGDVARYAGVFTQYITGFSRQFVAYQNYSFTENDFDNLWRLNLYGGPLQDLNILINQAAAEGHIHYQGVGEVLMAYGLGLATDLFGDMPYSQAFQGDANLQPRFDTQQQIYNTIQSLLTAGITHLNATDNTNVQPGDLGEDLMYGGDVALWTQFANGLKARYFMHLSKVSASNVDSALAYTSGGLTGNADDAKLVYGQTETTSNPWYQYIQQRDDILYDGYCLQTMLSLNDPRYGVYIDTADVY